MSSSILDFQALLVPMQLDAFVLNPAVCGTGEEDDTTAHICPITQPNYTFLRLQNFLIQSDVQNHADLHNTAPAEVNSRMMDLGARPVPQPLRHRHGVYIHWTLPRFYRSGVSSGKTVPQDRRRRERLRHGVGAAPPGAKQGANDTPDFVQPPTRWVVVRKLDVDSIQPEESKPAFTEREYEAWVVESDYLWSLDDIPLDADLQTDLAPFVTGHAGSDINIEEQAEVFIGRKTPLAKWTPDDPNNSDTQPPNISLLRSANQLFADFQMHNSNVFSVLDNFEYIDDNGQKQYLSHAKASYYLLGWHWKDDADPLWNSTQATDHRASLDSLLMKMQGAIQNPGDWAGWLDETSPLRAFCHGTMYDVTWDHDRKPATAPADQHNARIRDQTQAAVSVGTTPMDALISYCHARKGQGDIGNLEEDILALESLLHARDDGVEAQREAKDTVYNWSFNRSPGGLHYHFSGQDQGGKQPVEPERPAVLELRELNQTQSLLDGCSTAITQYRWDMFSLWWKFMSDVGNSGDSEDKTKTDEFKKAVDDLSKHINGLQGRMQQLQQKIDDLLNPQDGSQDLLATAKAASMPVFYRANDPTVLIGGIPSGWPLDYLDKVAVRAPFQTIPARDSSSLPAALKGLSALLQKQLPDVLKAPADALVTEFYLIRPGGGDSGTAPEGKFYPQFHDTVTSDGSWRDQWGDRQPWFPLYVEWEAEYTHVPFNYWKLDEHTTRLSVNEMVRYGITVPSGDGQEQPPLWQALADEQRDKGLDTRVLSGRVLILPQPSFSLGAKIAQLFDNTPPDILDEYLSKEDRESLRNNVSKLSYLSSPLSGFTGGLVTLAEGSHIKPENKIVSPEGESSSAIAAAVNEAVGLTTANIELIQGKSASTPYAALANFLDSEWCPFKPVTHGQFRFRKLNIIDKFGQSLVPISQEPRVNGPPPLYPCISDFYEPQTIKLEDGKEYANTVLQDNAAQCEFLQLPPQVNQNARLNATFVKRIADDPKDERKRFRSPKAPDTGTQGPATWRLASEWENPIWGWVITNWADYGIQLFLPDGTFYREVRFGGPLGALDAPKCLPFSPDKDTQPTPETRQLDALVDKLVDPVFLKGFWYMITTAQEKLPAAPNAYAQFLNSIVGKPLALVNTGWSLELDAPPFVVQSTKSKVMEPERHLTEPADSESKKDYYQLQVRLGDRDAAYDGLVGYFDTTAPGTDELNLDYIKTFFAPEKDQMTPLKPLNTGEYPLFTPFWEPPYPTEAPYDDPTRQIQPVDFDDRRNARMSVFGAIVDPFTPVHAYSSFLPSSELLLPTWTWQKAMDTMTAFFHAGPLTVPLNDVPDYSAAEKLTTQNARDIPKRDIQLPSLGPGDWSWFEPYAVEGEGDGQPVFNPFGIEKRGDLTKPGFQSGPYTAIEGFLQLRNPILMPKESTTR
ncbi:hypothetical protein TOPH_07324 [Tolypocladium ophioglossoides CBS 100239]|uniref:Uncharacterized protein n=1 Tax=Tolypocladium ophioglossoides (strain CBS 100239) TaxID=1163406 RepID=A0A0L0N2Q9_TOLOC|nr:hypothetical protein TOPH_07324 [Tolypocladium ophioglossoides CBS 100239]